MMLIIFPALILLASQPITASDDFSDKELKWPTTYKLEAKKISVSSGVIEEFVSWVTPNASRLDNNHGAVRKIYNDNYNVSELEYGREYEIHPETTKDETIEFSCKIREGTEAEPKTCLTVLPSLDDDYENLGEDFIDDFETYKFYFTKTEDKTETRKTIWAEYDSNSESWLPSRYEVKTYNTWLGSLSTYEIWEFYNVELEVDQTVFDIVNEYQCDTEEMSWDSEDVTKHLKSVDPENENHVARVFDAFKTKFSRTYAHEDEHEMRKRIFQKNMRLIVSTNQQNLGYTLGVTQFADRTPGEMERHKGLRRRPAGKVGNVPFPYTNKKINDIVNDLPTEYDSRIDGLVTKIKNQESCGSCWTFGTTAAVEGALAKINGGTLYSLANQAVLDCAWGFGGAGCDGGTDNAAYEWMMQYGLPTEEEYGSYVNSDGFCKIKNMTKTFKIRGFTDVTPFSVGALKVAVFNHGPLTVSIDATDKFGLYTGGIYYDTTCTTKNLNHEITLVGYGESNGETFWIIKNSWGPNWGVDGYLLISSRDNNCGIASEPTYVVF